MTHAKMHDAFGRLDDGTDGRRAMARAMAPPAGTSRGIRLTPRGAAVVAALRLGVTVDPVALEYVTLPRVVTCVTAAHDADSPAGAGVVV